MSLLIAMRGAVARVDDGVVGQDEQAFPDRGDDPVEVRVVPAGGPRAALEEGVAGESHSVGDETRRARGVPRGRDRPQRDPGDRELVAVGDRPRSMAAELARLRERLLSTMGMCRWALTRGWSRISWGRPVGSGPNRRASSPRQSTWV